MERKTGLDSGGQGQRSHFNKRQKEEIINLSKYLSTYLNLSIYFK